MAISIMVMGAMTNELLKSIMLAVLDQQSVLIHAKIAKQLDSPQIVIRKIE